jgi:hypothetical protein
MGRIAAFLLGFVVGGLTLYSSMQYHFVHAQDGWHPIRKTTARLSETIVDIRQFGPRDWVEHPGLAAAISQTENTELMRQLLGDAVRQPFQESVDSIREAIELPASR